MKKIFWQFFLFSFFFFLLFSFFVKSLIFGSLDFENSDNKIDDFSQEEEKKSSENKKYYETKWQNGTTIYEIKIFIAIHLLMGIVRLPRTDDYWCKDHIPYLL